VDPPHSCNRSNHKVPLTRKAAFPRGLRLNPKGLMRYARMPKETIGAPVVSSDACVSDAGKECLTPQRVSGETTLKPGDGG